MRKGWASPLSSDWSAVPVPVPYANLTNPQTLNLYSMVHDDPESFADLDGHNDAPYPAPGGDLTADGKPKKPTKPKPPPPPVIVHVHVWEHVDPLKVRTSMRRFILMSMEEPLLRVLRHPFVGAILMLAAADGGGAAEETIEKAADEAAEEEMVEAAEEAAAQNSAQMKRLSDGEIKELKNRGIDPHDLKPNQSMISSKTTRERFR